MCSPFPDPIKQATSQDFSTTPTGANAVQLTVTDHIADGSTQVFIWDVDNSLVFTPRNDLAQVASDHCSFFGQSTG